MSSRAERSEIARMERVQLTKKQKECAHFKPAGHLLVRGIPGSGKTTVLLERARFLLSREETENPRVIVMTYNRTLSNYVRQLSLKNGDTPVEATTFHQWGLKQLSATGVRRTNLVGDQRSNLVAFARNIVRKENPRASWPTLGKGNLSDRELITFLGEEFSWIKENAIEDRGQYLTTSRRGRGKSLLKAHRETVYTAFEKYQQLLRNKGLIDFDDVIALLAKNMNRLPEDRRPQHVLVDEAQDLTPTQFRILSELAMRSLTIAGDKGQGIYRRAFSWRDVGIDITGSRSKLLTTTFRSTRQIVQLARSLQSHDTSLKKDGEYIPPEDPEAEGPLPELFCSSDSNVEMETVLKWVQSRRASFQNDSIGIIAVSHRRLDQFAAALDERAIPHVRVAEDQADITSPGVKLVTYHSSKGLEFDHVIVTGLKKGEMPLSVPAADDEADWIATERRKLYVAMTRAKLTLALSARLPLSPFLGELDTRLYRDCRK